MNQTRRCPMILGLASLLSLVVCLSTGAAIAEGPAVLPTPRWSWSFGQATLRMRPATSARKRSVMSPKLDRKQVEVTEPTRMVTNVSQTDHHDLSAGEG